MKILLQYIERLDLANKFSIFSSPAIELNHKLYDPNFTKEEKKQLRTILRLLINEYLIEIFNWEEKKAVRNVLAKIPHQVFTDKKLQFDTYVGKYFIPFMKKSKELKYLIDQTDLRKLQAISISEFLQLEIPINQHPLFQIKKEERPKDPKEKEGSEETKADSDEVEIISTITEGQMNQNVPNPIYLFIAYTAQLSTPNAIKFGNEYNGEVLTLDFANNFFVEFVSITQFRALNFARALMELTDGNEFETTILFNKPGVFSVKDLAKDISINWEAIIQTELYAVDASYVEKKIAQAHPTDYVMARLDNQTQPLRDFLINNPRIDIFQHKINFDGDKRINWSGIVNKNRPTLKRQIQQFLRIKLLVQDIRDIPQLINAGYIGAHDILHTGRESFLQKNEFSTNETANLVYKRSLQVANITTSTLALHLESQQNVSLPFINTSNNSSVDDLDYQALFGSLSSCHCEHCNSVLSPAAYLVDLFHFLKTNNLNALEELRRRRPDLWNIKLSCEETNTTQTYLKLIVEVLEEFVVTQANEVFPSLPDEISALLYMPLISPLTPFEAEYEETKLYAEESHTSLFEIYYKMEMDLSILMAEKIGLGPQTLVSVLAGQLGLPNTSPRKYKVSKFSNLFSINFKELTALVNNSIGENLSLVSEMIYDSSNRPVKLENYVLIATKTSTPLIEAANYLKKIFTFLRIYKHLDYTIEEIDTLLSLSQTSSRMLNSKHIRDFSTLLFIRDRFEFSNSELELLINGYSEKVEEMFGGKFLENKPEQLASLSIFLGITEDEFILLVEYYKSDLEYRQDILLLNVKNLSFLNRNILWARKLNLSIEDWLLLVGINNTKTYLIKNNLSSFLENILFFERLDLPLKLIRFYIQGVSSPEWSYSLAKENILIWLKDLSVDGNSIDSNVAFSEKLAELFNVPKAITKTVIEQVEFHGKEKYELAKVVSLINFIITDSSSIIENENNLEAEFEINIKQEELSLILRVLGLFDRQLQFIDYLNFEDSTLAFFFNHLTEFKINRKNPIQLILGMNQFSRWMDGLGNDLVLFEELSSISNTGNSGGGEGLEEELEILKYQVLSIDKDSVFEILSLFKLSSFKLSDHHKFFNAITLCKDLSWSPDQLFYCLNAANISKFPRAYYKELSSYFEESFQKTTSLKFDEIKERVEDKLLSKKRDVLIAILKGLLDFDNTDKIYEYFLLDVETSTCSDVSPIKAAILSVQLFIQRCLMGLERTGTTKLIFDQELKEEWEWRKNYRVWEANRKVFLYPENYLDPNLRDNKTPIYEELEGDILQRDISPVAIEKVYFKYLKEFSTVAKLTMAGSFKGDSHDYYYFARTENLPYKYYYRIYNRSSRFWSPWQAIDVNISSGYLAGIIVYGRMYIFWKSTKVITISEFENGLSQKTRKELKQIITYCYKEEDGSWSTPNIVDANVKGSWKIEDPDPNDEFDHEIKLNAYPGQFEDFILLKRLNEQVTVSFSNNLIYENSVLNRYEAQIVLDIVSNKFISKTNQSNQQIPSYLGYVTLTDNGVELFKPNGNFSEYYRMNLYGGSDGHSSFGPVITSSSPISITNGQEIGNYTLQNKGMNYQYLMFNSGLYPLNSYVVTTLSNKIFTSGLDSFLKPETQLNTTENSYLDIQTDVPGHPLNLFLPDQGLDFDGPNGIYFKEMYFHIPLTIAKHYNNNQKYQEADFWYKKIFDPTVEYENEGKYWQYAPFRNDISLQKENILKDTAALSQYKKDPFNPHAIARLRTAAYPKAVVMGYIDNLLDWADQLFQKDTYESINEAMMLYVVGRQLLGEKPITIVSCDTLNEDKTISDVIDLLSVRNEILIEVESMNAEINLSANIPFSDDESVVFNLVGNEGTDVDLSHQGNIYALENPTLMYALSNNLLFCVPWNELLLEYWDRIEDRLFKIRNCQNFDGVYRQLALFEPAIDPMLLVIAKANGISIDQLLQINNISRLPYRFNYLLEKAKSYIQIASSFGQAFLSTLEKEDGEALNELRTVHENNILQMSTLNREKQIEVLERGRTSLEIQKTKAEYNINHFNSLLQSNGFNAFNKADKKFEKSSGYTKITSTLSILTSVLYLIPQLGAPTAMKFGGKEAGDAAKSGMKGLYSLGEYMRMTAELMEKYTNQVIKNKGWQQQLFLSQKELENNENELLLNSLRQTIARNDLESHQRTIEQKEELLDFYSQKMTNQALYNAMSGHLTKLFREAYALAYRMALYSQEAYRFETNDISTEFISMDNWDTATMGLLSAEKMQFQLMQMESAYLEKNLRKIEIKTHISMSMVDPEALLRLKTTSECEVYIPETWFDIQYPGQYKRRIKSVSITIPCVVGPYVNVPCKLKLNSSRIRINADLDDNSMVPAPVNEQNNQVFTSSGQNDNGLLDFNFKHEYLLPFEGDGVDSVWSLKLPNTVRSFNYNTISDVIFHIDYVAEYNTDFQQEVEGTIENSINALNPNGGLVRVMSLKHDFSNEWFKAISKNEPMEITLEEIHFPYFTSRGSLNLEEASLEVIDTNNPIDDTSSASTVSNISGALPKTVTINIDADEKDKELFLILRYKI